MTSAARHLSSSIILVNLLFRFLDLGLHLALGSCMLLTRTMNSFESPLYFHTSLFYQGLFLFCLHSKTQTIPPYHLVLALSTYLSVHCAENVKVLYEGQSVAVEEVIATHRLHLVLSGYLGTLQICQALLDCSDLLLVCSHTKKSCLPHIELGQGNTLLVVSAGGCLVSGECSCARYLPRALPSRVTLVTFHSYKLCRLRISASSSTVEEERACMQGEN